MQVGPVDVDVPIDTTPPEHAKTITYWQEAGDDGEDDWIIIRHEETGVTTQSRTILGAILMLADAINGVEDRDADLMAMAEDVFVADDELLANLDATLVDDGNRGDRDD